MCSRGRRVRLVNSQYEAVLLEHFAPPDPDIPRKHSQPVEFYGMSKAHALAILISAPRFQCNFNNADDAANYETRSVEEEAEEKILPRKRNLRERFPFRGRVEFRRWAMCWIHS